MRARRLDLTAERAHLHGETHARHRTSPSASVSGRFRGLGCCRLVPFAVVRCVAPVVCCRLVSSVVGRFANFSLTSGIDLAAWGLVVAKRLGTFGTAIRSPRCLAYHSAIRR